MAVVPISRLARIRPRSYAFLVLVAVLVAAAPGSLRAQVRVLPLGDSITQGKNTTYPGYREQLWHLLRDGGYDVDFIGTLKGHYDVVGPAGGYDPDHEGHGGWWADHILRGNRRPNEGTGNGQLSDWLQGYTPDVVLIQLGTNDLNNDSGSNTNLDETVVNETRDEIGEIIDVLRGDNPEVIILLGLLIPADATEYPNRDRRIPLLNAKLQTLGEQKDSDVSPVIVVDHVTGFDPDVHTFDGLHTNQAGDRLMAERWFEVLQTVIEPAPPNEPPVARFTVEPASGAAPLKVTFDASGSTDSDGTIAGYAWDFGDGKTGSGPDPTHTYENPGTYTATLTITDNDGATDDASLTLDVAVPNQAPVASFTADPTSGIAPLGVTFDASGSSDPDGVIVSYAWNFGDGARATGPTASHTYENTGTYRATLTVTDDDGAQRTSFLDITVRANGSPEPFALTAPADDSIERTKRPRLTWEAAKDPDAGDQIRYRVYWSRDSLFTNVTPAEIDSTSYVPQALEENKRYWWRVEAVDTRGLTTATGTRRFWIDAEPEPPRPVALIAPRDHESISDPAPVFTWSRALDEDPNDEPEYRLRIAADREFTEEVASLDVGADTSAVAGVTLADAQTYYWRVDAVDRSSLTTQSPVAAFTVLAGTDVEEPGGSNMPETYTLDQNYPNPAASQTTIRYGLPVPAHVVLSVYDLTGRLVATPVQQQMPSGWHEATFDARDLPNGLYIYHLRADSFAVSRKMLVIR